MPTRRTVIDHEPWCTEHGEDDEDSYCHTAEFTFGRSMPATEFSTDPVAGSLEVSRGTRDADDVVWLQYSRLDPPSHFLASINRSALGAMREALIEDPHGFTQAVFALHDELEGSRQGQVVSTFNAANPSRTCADCGQQLDTGLHCVSCNAVAAAAVHSSADTQDVP